MENKLPDAWWFRGVVKMIAYQVFLKRVLSTTELHI